MEQAAAPKENWTMANTTISLETFDVLELLYLLAGQRRTGALQIIRDDAQFTMWLEGGRVRAVRFGVLSGAGAVRRLLLDPRGHSTFLPGVQLATPLNWTPHWTRPCLKRCCTTFLSPNCHSMVPAGLPSRTGWTH
ncbi:DUF4388 domain-containing protein [Deinococcus malanensis]|uniref:DUF4388 domain-containing protein n=1 Tax=Deinococcus malanensis TaxID=1706855 RepID=UPI00363CA776